MNNYYDTRVREIEALLNTDKHVACVRECGSLIEPALRELLLNLMRDLDNVNAKSELLAAERAFAKGDETVKRFGLGQLVGLYREANVFDKLRKHLTSNVQKVNRINWNAVVSMRNAAAHDEAKAEISQDDAAQMLLWLKTLLYDTELLGNPTIVEPVNQLQHPKVIDSCPECRAVLDKKWKFCPACGTCVYNVCSACNRELSPDFKICPYCETPIRGTTASAQALYEYEILCRGAYLDHVVNARERKMLDEGRLKLGLSTEEAEEIERRCAPANILQYTGIVEAACLDGSISVGERHFLDRKIKELKLDPEIAAEIEKEMLNLHTQHSKLEGAQNP